MWSLPVVVLVGLTQLAPLLVIPVAVEVPEVIWQALCLNL